DKSLSAYYIIITDMLGRTKLMLPKPNLDDGIDIGHLSKGIYHITIIENKTKQSITKNFAVE
ncbi:MAG: hypothetical protein RLZZ161_1616, partial [Bacteroidota bacterium]